MYYIEYLFNQMTEKEIRMIKENKTFESVLTQLQILQEKEFRVQQMT